MVMMSYYNELQWANMLSVFKVALMTEEPHQFVYLNKSRNLI